MGSCYQVSDMGRVKKTYKSGDVRIVEPLVGRPGSQRGKSLHVSIDGKYRSLSALVLNNFVEEKDYREYRPLYIDGDHSNCAVVNLQWELQKK